MPSPARLPRTGGRRRLAGALALWAGLGLSGCAPSAFVLADPSLGAERGRSQILVVPAEREPENAAIVREAARLLAAELGSRWFNVLDPGWEASSPALLRTARQLLTGARAEPAVVAGLAGRGIGQLLLVDLYAVEQAWGRRAKRTRVGLDVRLVQLQEGRVLWQGRYAPELSAPGDGVATALRRSVQELARRLGGGPRQFRDTAAADWMAEQPLLEYLAPE